VLLSHIIDTSIYNTPEWRIFKKKILEKKGPSPYGRYCSSKKGLNLLSYFSTTFDENPDQYEVVCNKCLYGFNEGKKRDFKRAWEFKQ